MLDLESVDGGVRLTLEVIGYEFPEVPDDDWCLVQAAVQHGTQSFRRVDPALEAAELPGLRDWFRALAEDRLPRWGTLFFTEPCLSFSFLGKSDDGVRFSVHLSHELKPAFPLVQLGQATEEWEVVFLLDQAGLARAIEGVEGAMKQYPVRRSRSDSSDTQN